MAPASFRVRGDDDNIEPAIRLDVVRSFLPEDNRRDPLRGAVDDHPADRLADVAVAAARISGRASRTETPDRTWRADERRRLDRILLYQHDLGVICDLWFTVRNRHRHRLYRHHRIDGEVVPGAQRLCRRRGGRWIRFRSNSDNLSDRQHDQSL